MFCCPAGNWRLAGVDPTKAPFSSISAPSGSEVIFTWAMALAGGAAGRGSRGHGAGAGAGAGGFLQRELLVGKHVDDDAFVHRHVFALHEQKHGRGGPEHDRGAGRERAGAGRVAAAFLLVRRIAQRNDGGVDGNTAFDRKVQFSGASHAALGTAWVMVPTRVAPWAITSVSPAFTSSVTASCTGWPSSAVAEESCCSRRTRTLLPSGSVTWARLAEADVSNSTLTVYRSMSTRDSNDVKGGESRRKG